MKSYNNPLIRSSRIIVNPFGVFLILLFFFIADRGFSQGISVVTFTEAINQGIKNNQGFTAQQSNLLANEKDIEIAKSNFLPNLHFSATVMPSQGQKINDYHGLGLASGTQGLYSAGFNQMIYNEEFFANHKIQKSLYISQQEQFRSERYQLINAVGEAYINALIAQDLLAVLIENMRLTEKNLEAAIYRAEIGSSSFQETLRWKTQLYADQKNITGQRANIVTNRALLNQLRNQPIEQIEILEELTLEKDGFIFSSSFINKSLEDDVNKKIIRDFLVQIGLPNSPDISSMDAEIEAQNRQLKSDKRWLIPNFSFVAGFDELFLTKEDDTGAKQKNGLEFWFVGASARWNVFNGGSNFSKIKQSQFQQEAMEYQRKEITTTLEQEIRSGVSILIADYLKVNLSHEQADVAGKNYEMVYDSYLVGEVALLDLLDAQEQKFKADYSEIISYYTFLLNLLSIEEAIGYFPFLESKNEVTAIVLELERQLLGN